MHFCTGMEMSSLQKRISKFMLKSFIILTPGETQKTNIIFVISLKLDTWLKILARGREL